MQRRSKFILLSAYIFFCILLAMLIWWAGTPVCLREECIKQSKFTILKMNPKANPCNNIYEFVCGKALTVPKDNTNTKETSLKNIQTKTETIKSKNPLHYIARSDSYFSLMSRKVHDYLSAAKVEGLEKADSPVYHEMMIGFINRMCEQAKFVNQDTLAYLNFKFLLDESLFGTGMSLRDMFIPKRFNQSVSAGVYEYKLRMAGFPGQHYFKSEIRLDHNEPDKKALYIERGVPSVSITESGEFDTYATREKSIEIWVILFGSLSRQLVPSAGEEDITDEQLGKVMDLLFDISDARMMEEGVQTTFNKQPLDKLQKQFPDLDFKGYLQEIIEDKKNIPTYIYMADKSKAYFAALGKVLRKPGRTRQMIVLVQVFHCMFDYVRLLRTNRVLSTNLKLDSFRMTDSRFCKEQLSPHLTGMVLSLAIERFKVRRNGADAIKNMLGHLKGVLENSIHESTWMDKATKNKGIKKLRTMTERISVSNMQFNTINTGGKRNSYYNGLCVSKRMLTTIMCVNKFSARKEFSLFKRQITGFDKPPRFDEYSIQYQRSENRLYVPVFILREPVFEEKWPWNVNYGITGSEMGLALTHGFDKGGSKNNEFGKEGTWWTNMTYTNYNKLVASCSSLSSQAFAIKSRNSNNYANARSFTMKDVTEKAYQEIDDQYDRNWEYVTGVRLAYRAYVKYTKENKYKDSSLPGLENYSPEQVLFLSHARMYCPRPDDTNEITLGTKRYFKAIAGLKEFKEAFGCSKGDSTVSKAVNKCLLF